MKNLIKPAAFAAAIILSSFIQPANASGGPHLWFSSVKSGVESENSFSLAVNRRGSDEVISISIQNPAKKNLSISLSGPDGSTIDNFNTGRRFASISRDYNFTGAEDGLYTLVISDGASKITRKVKLERQLQPVSKLVVE